MHAEMIHPGPARVIQIH